MLLAAATASSDRSQCVERREAASCSPDLSKRSKYADAFLDACRSSASLLDLFLVLVLIFFDLGLALQGTNCSHGNLVSRERNV